MASVHIIRRRTKAGARRYLVRYRTGGRDTALRHAGSFGTLAEAEERARYIGGELAAKRVPDLRIIVPVLRTFAEVAERWRASRLDHAEQTAKNTGSHLRRILPRFGSCDPADITPADIQEWVAAQADLKPSSVARYLATLRMILDYADLESNPARDRSVRLPRIVREEPQPPSRAEVALIVAHSPPRWRLPLRLLEATGMRVGELSSLRWGDVDLSGCRLRVSRTRTKGNTAGQRWVQVPAPLMVEIDATCPPDDRTRDRAVFGGVTADGAKNAMARACVAAGIAHCSPHSLRHRRLSLWHAQGVPARELAARAGHARASMSLDTYSHVLVDPDDEWA